MDNSESVAEVFDDLCARVTAGEEIDRAWIIEHYPQLVHEIDELLPTLQLLLGFGQSSAGADQSATTLPPALDEADLGDYALIRELGRGGMGIVYEAEQVSVGRRVALKILPFAALLNKTQLERFSTEATAAARLHHPSIVQVYSVGCERGIHFYAMQLIDGPSLAEVITEMRQERTPVGEEGDTVVAKQADVLTRDEDGGHYTAVARIGREAAEALHYAHDIGVLHRDIKPSNLLLDKSGHVWIADFGLARVEDESQLTRTGDILGTLRYMSPEQATGERVDARSDVYSLGATLYELATLGPVYDAEDRRDIVKQVLAGNPIAPHIVDSRIPKPLSHVIAKAMARLDERYQSAQELAGDLQRFLDGEPVSAKPPTRLRRARAWSRRHRLASTAIIGLLLFSLLLPFTHHFFQRVPDDSQTKGQDMKVSKTAKVAAAAAAIAMVTADVNAKKPVPPPPDPEPGLTVHYELSGVQFEPGADIWGTMGNLVAQDDGKFLMSGVYESAEFPLGVAQVTRFDALGEVDVNFGNQGTVVADVGLAGGRDHAQDLMVQMVDGEARIVVVGRCDNYSSPWIARFLPNGLFDGSFGGDGKVDDILPDDSAGFMSLCVLSDGIIAAGRIQDSPTSLLLVKFLSDGSVDESFGNSGYSIINIGQEIHLMKGPVELDDGRLVAAGAGPNVQTSAIFMFTSDGSLDASFGNGGIAEIDLGAYEFFHDLAVQPDGKIVAVGATSNDAGAVYGVAESQRFTIARFNSDGSPDRKFARPKGGKELDLAAGGVGKFTSVKLLSDGRIIALGHGKPTPDIGSGDLYLARFQANGNFDTTFDEDGWINLDILGGEFSTGLVVLGDDSYIVGGNGGVPPAGVSLYLAAVWEEEE